VHPINWHSQRFVVISDPKTIFKKTCVPYVGEYTFFSPENLIVLIS
jgi:hypothetical protein